MRQEGGEVGTRSVVSEFQILEDTLEINNQRLDDLPRITARVLDVE
jgi:hypothetical protein